MLRISKALTHLPQQIRYPMLHVKFCHLHAPGKAFCHKARNADTVVLVIVVISGKVPVNSRFLCAHSAGASEHRPSQVSMTVEASERKIQGGQFHAL